MVSNIQYIICGYFLSLLLFEIVLDGNDERRGGEDKCIASEDNLSLLFLLIRKKVVSNINDYS